MKFLLLPALAGCLALGACGEADTDNGDNNTENVDPKAQQVAFTVDGLT